MEYPLALECDEYIVNARRKLAAIIQQTGTGEASLKNEEPTKTVTKKRSFSRDRLKRKESMEEKSLKAEESSKAKKTTDKETQKAKDVLGSQESTNSSATTKKHASKPGRVEAKPKSTFSQTSNKTGLSIRSTPRVLWRSKSHPKLTVDKCHEKTAKPQPHSRSDDQQLKDRLERMSLDSAICIRPSTAPINEKPRANGRGRNAPSRSIVSDDTTPPTPALSESSWPASRSSTSSIEPPSTPPPIPTIPEHRVIPDEIPPKNPARYASGLKPLICPKARSLANSTAPRFERISCPSYDQTSMLSSSWTNSEIYENPRDSVPIPIEQLNLSRPTTDYLPPVPPVPALPSFITTGTSDLVSKPEYQHEEKVTIVAPSYSYFDDSSDYEEELSDTKPSWPTTPHNDQTDPAIIRDHNMVSSIRNEKKSALANGYAHMKDGNLHYSPAYMRVSPSAALKARKALDKKQQEADPKKAGFLRKLSSMFVSKSAA